MCPSNISISRWCATSDSPSFDKKFGINKQLAIKICELAFDHDIAQLTLEFAQPRVVELVKDKRVTFPDILGTIGEKNDNKNIKCPKFSLLKISWSKDFNFSRRNHWIIHRTKPNQYHRNIFLDLQDSQRVSYARKGKF